MNFLLTNIHFGVKRFRQFRKKLVLDYKKGDKHAHKNPHAIPLVEKQRLLKSHKGGDWRTIRQMQRQSLTPFGRFAKHGFIFQRDKLPTYDIPNIDNFQLLPYVEYLAPLLNKDLLNYQSEINKEKISKLQLSGSDSAKSIQNKK